MTLIADLQIGELEGLDRAQTPPLGEQNLGHEGGPAPLYGWHVRVT